MYLKVNETLQHINNITSKCQKCSLKCRILSRLITYLNSATSLFRLSVRTFPTLVKIQKHGLE